MIMNLFKGMPKFTFLNKINPFSMALFNSAKMEKVVSATLKRGLDDEGDELEYDHEMDRLYSFPGEKSGKTNIRKKQKTNDKSTMFWMETLNRISNGEIHTEYEVHNFLIMGNGQTNRYIQQNIMEMINEINDRFTIWDYRLETDQLEKRDVNLMGPHVALIVNPPGKITTDIVVKFIGKMKEQGIRAGLIIVNQDEIVHGSAPMPLGIITHTFGSRILPLLAQNNITALTDKEDNVPPPPKNKYKKRVAIKEEVEYIPQPNADPFLLDTLTEITEEEDLANMVDYESVAKGKEIDNAEIEKTIKEYENIEEGIEDIVKYGYELELEKPTEMDEEEFEVMNQEETVPEEFVITDDLFTDAVYSPVSSDVEAELNKVLFESNEDVNDLDQELMVEFD